MSCGSGRGHNEYENNQYRDNEGDKDEALRILGVRLAKGEITKQDYQDLKGVLYRQEGGKGLDGTNQEGSHHGDHSDDQPYRSRPRRLFGGGC
jgi:hypothetical protein